MKFHKTKYRDSRVFLYGRTDTVKLSVLIRFANVHKKVVCILTTRLKSKNFQIQGHDTSWGCDTLFTGRELPK